MKSIYSYLQSIKPYDFSTIKEEVAKDDFIFENGYNGINDLPIFEGNLGNFVFQMLAKRPWKTVLTDYSSDNPRVMRAGMLLAVSLLLAKKFKKHINERRVGIALPAGAGSHIANLALMFANKTPVNLNFTVGRSTIESAIEQAGIKTVISASTLLERFSQFPWPKNVLDLPKLITKLNKFSLVRTLIEIFLLPTKVLSKRFRISTIGGDNEATLVFSSGTTGKPKGIVLSHKNLISNCIQIKMLGLLRSSDSILASLPIFHSFGMLINMWFCLLFGIRTATCPSPLDIKKIASVIDKEKLTITLSTPTFFKQYLGKISPESIRSLRAVAAGGEKVNIDLIDSWEKTFKSEMVAGYGLTEASPIVSLNFPHDPKSNIENNKRGSVGRIMPGISVKFIGPETGKPMPIGETGILCMKGPNIFKGYLDDELLTQQTFRDGWLVTGDLARLDADGFLHIEGRISRFSKIGGEMVPHVGLEDAISKALSFTHEDGPDIAIMSKIDKKKGESLVLLSKKEIDMQLLREKLLQAGISALWIPKVLISVDNIPTLATGKLDLGACKQIVESKLLS